MPKQRMRLLFPLVVAALAVLGLAPLSARADNLESFNFSGALSNAYNGNNTVTGSFTLDTTTGTITAFDFTTPVITVDAANGFTAGVVTYTPATSPNQDFVELYFDDTYADSFWLLFETPLSSFDGSSFYTQEVQETTGSTGSQLGCSDGPVSNCSDANFGSGFTSGGATPSPSPVPEPSPLVLLGSALMLLAAGSSLRRMAKAGAAGRPGLLGGNLNALLHGFLHLGQTQRDCARQMMH